MNNLSYNRLSEEDLDNIAREGLKAEKERFRRWQQSYRTKLVSALGPALEAEAPEPAPEPEIVAPVGPINPEAAYQGVVMLLQAAGAQSAQAICKQLNLSKAEWASVRARIGRGNADVEISGQRRGTKYSARQNA